MKYPMLVIVALSLGGCASPPQPVKTPGNTMVIWFSEQQRQESQNTKETIEVRLK